MKRIYPLCAPSLREIEAEVLGAGQMLLSADCTPRARLALETIHRARLKLGQLSVRENGYSA